MNYLFQQQLNDWELTLLLLKRFCLKKIECEAENFEKWNKKIKMLDESWEILKEFYGSED